MGPRERDYLAACRQAENEAKRKERSRKRVITFGSLAAVLVIAVAGGFAYIKAQNEKQAKDSEAMASVVAATLLQTAGETADAILEEQAKTFDSADRERFMQLTRKVKDKISELNERDKSNNHQEQLVDQYLDETLNEQFLRKYFNQVAQNLPPAEQASMRIMIKMTFYRH